MAGLRGQGLGEAFGIDLAESPLDSPAFWRAVQDAYEAGPWKGGMLYELDSGTLAMRPISLGGVLEAAP